MDKDIKTISTFSLFSGLGAENIKAALECLGCYFVTYQKGDYITLEQNGKNSLGVVVGGLIHLLKVNIWGDKTLFAVIRQGEIFGEEQLDQDTSTGDTAFLVVEDCKILFMPFAKVLNPCPKFCIIHRRLTINLLGIMARKNNLLQTRIDITSPKTIRKKVLSYLYSQGEAAMGEVFKIPFGRGELAHYLSVDRSALSRELAALKDEGIIDFDKNSYRLLVDITKIV